MGIKYNDWMRDNPTYEINTAPPTRQEWASLRDSECELAIGENRWGRGGLCADAIDAGPENRPCVVKGVRVHRQSMNESSPPPPIASLPSCVFFLFWRISPSFPLLLYWGISLRGRNPPHWGLRGCIIRINELEVNMQSVCWVPHYTSQPIGFHQKLRWIVSPIAHFNAFQCFI